METFDEELVGQLDKLHTRQLDHFLPEDAGIEERGACDRT